MSETPETAPADTTHADTAQAEAVHAEATPAETATTTPESTALALEAHANTVVRHNIYLAAVAGVIPFSFVDTAALIAVQLKLVHDLAGVYGKDFRADVGKAAISSLLASVTPTLLTGGVVRSGLVTALSNAVPAAGLALRIATQPAFGAAFTYAVGKVFQHHFATGGDLLSFEVAKARDFFTSTFNQARGKSAKELAAPAPEAAAA
ncbi:YcjF family protein [Nitrospirillum sp. BR 11828]|uniref:YcjF family protein n=1 Tax=Nitrospirillum sp. BR 11828 TaxID=3104325 RepID=UPI002ACAB5A5|nr:DUF697 domain-containing protein [Nitrospirillum sp. BR 11828]MDZ5645859.1 DUF697 domain-containing protein [Nitrospirillum sp. BR 11828]